MAADYQATAVKILKTTWKYTAILALNTLRRGMILGRYTLICWQQQKLRRAMRHLGTGFFAALERGEVHPLVVDEVSQALRRAKDIKEGKERHYQAIAAIRERIRTSCTCETPAAAPDKEPRAGGPEA